MLQKPKFLKTQLEDLNRVVDLIDHLIRDKEVIEDHLVIEEVLITEVLRDLEIILEEDFRVSHNSISKDNNLE
jgi:hypothetical protein